MAGVINTVMDVAHWREGVGKVMVKLVSIKRTKSNSKLSDPFLPSLSLIPNISFRFGRILFKISFLKEDLRTRLLVEASRLFHFSVVDGKNDKAKLSVR